MRIDRYSSEQFAGVRDHEAEFEPGMNVVLGDNETGKSTMIAAIFYALTRAAKLNKTTAADKQFIERYFPTSGAKTIDSTVRFTQDGKKYELTKLWDLTAQDTGFKLRQIGGDTLRGSQAEERLKSLVQFGPSVYNNLIFGRQNHEDEILQWCYSFFSEKDDESIDAVRKQIGSAVSAASGISPEKIMAEIEKRLSDLGDRWDFDRDAPEKKSGASKRWEKGLGEILKAWYKLEDADNECREAENTETRVADITKKLDAAREEQAKAKTTQKVLLEQQGAIESLTLLKQGRDRDEKALMKAEAAQKEWPSLITRIEEGKKLQQLQEELSIRERKSSLEKRIQGIASLQKEIKALETALQKWPDIDADYAAAQKLPHKVEVAKATLGSAKLHATVHLESGRTAQMLVEGSTQEVTGDVDTDINGYFHMDIPGVATIQVAPQDIDVKKYQQEIADAEAALDEILKKYKAPNLDALGNLAKEAESTADDLEQKQRELASLLGQDTLEGIIGETDGIHTTPDLAIPDNLDDLIAGFLQNDRSLDVAISLAESTVMGYEREYTSQLEIEKTIGGLKGSIADQEKRIKTLSEQSSIPADEFEKKLTECNDALDTLELQIGGYQVALGELGEPGNITDLEAERDRLKDEWEALKRTYANYLKIQKDFAALQKQDDDRFSGFHAKFNEYLSAITGDNLAMEDNDGLSLTSGKNAVNKELLSAGTRKTLLLAFRLAVLSYYFPDGDGLVVLDDDLLDMDPGRRAQAAALLKSFSESNQVIFTTCDPAIADLLGGNCIKFTA